MVAALGALGAAGCVVTDDDDLPDYALCTYDSECDSFRCDTVTVSWGGMEVTDDFCTRSCDEDRDCPTTPAGRNGTCESVGGAPAACYETCTMDSECAPSWVCGDLGEGIVACVPGPTIALLPAYQPCSFDADCASGRCETVVADWGDFTATGSFCTEGCVDSVDCPDTADGLPGTCASLEGGPSLCYQTCDFDRDCAPGFACGDVGTGDTVCLPR